MSCSQFIRMWKISFNIYVEINWAKIKSTIYRLFFITNINAYLDKTNVTAVFSLPRALFPVSLVSVCTIFPRVSFVATWPVEPIMPLSPFAPSRPSRPGNPLCPLRPGTPGRPGDPCRHVLVFCVIKEVSTVIKQWKHAIRDALLIKKT